MERGRWVQNIPLSQEVLWKCSKESHHLSNPVSLSMPSLAAPPHLEEGTQTEGKSGYNPALQHLQDFNHTRSQLESEQSKEAQKLDHKYNARKIKMEWVRKAWKGDYTFQEMFSMTSSAESVKLFPWCISTGVPICHIDDALAATKQQGKTTLATLDAIEPEEPSAPGLSSSPTHSIETPPPAIPLLLDLPFESTPSMGCPFFQSFAGPSQKKRDCSPSRSFANHHGKRTQVYSPEVEVRSEHSSTWSDSNMLKLIPETRHSPGNEGRSPLAPF